MSDEQKTECPACKGLTVEFRGTGKDIEYRVCSGVDDNRFVHKSAKEVNREILFAQYSAHPSGRFA